jgi:hypothetical protein
MELACPCKPLAAHLGCRCALGWVAMTLVLVLGPALAGPDWISVCPKKLFSSCRPPPRVSPLAAKVASVSGCRPRPRTPGSNQPSFLGSPMLWRPPARLVPCRHESANHGPTLWFWFLVWSGLPASSDVGPQSSSCLVLIHSYLRRRSGVYPLRFLVIAA